MDGACAAHQPPPTSLTKTRQRGQPLPHRPAKAGRSARTHHKAGQGRVAASLPRLPRLRHRLPARPAGRRRVRVHDRAPPPAPRAHGHARRCLPRGSPSACHVPWSRLCAPCAWGCRADRVMHQSALRPARKAADCAAAGMQPSQNLTLHAQRARHARQQRQPAPLHPRPTRAARLHARQQRQVRGRQVRDAVQAGRARQHERVCARLGERVADEHALLVQREHRLGVPAQGRALLYSLASAPHALARWRPKALGRPSCGRVPYAGTPGTQPRARVLPLSGPGLSGACVHEALQSALDGSAAGMSPRPLSGRAPKPRPLVMRGVACSHANASALARAPC